MTGMHRFEDLLPDWRKAYAERVAAAAAVVVFGVLRPMSTDDLDETAIDG